MEDIKLIDLGILIDDDDDGNVRRINPPVDPRCGPIWVVDKTCIEHMN